MRSPRSAPKDQARNHLATRGVMRLLETRFGVDFSKYDASYFQEQIARRASAENMPSLESYAKFLRRSRKESERLYASLAADRNRIFTRFGGSDHLTRKLFAQLIGRTGDHGLRVWLAGCSTGEDAYVLTVLLLDLAERKGHNGPIQVFATDLYEQHIEQARKGRCPNQALRSLKPKQRTRFFTKEDGTSRAAKLVREKIVFARHDLLTDPPFSRINLISCGQSLSQFEPLTRRRVLSLLHYALAPQGWLLLGESNEAVNGPEMFELIDRRWGLFRKKQFPEALLTPARGGYGRKQAQGRLAVGAPVLKPLGVADPNRVVAVARIMESAENIARPGRGSASKRESSRIRNLEQELLESREQLGHFLEQTEAAQEELQAANEELSSSNEELQSINEALDVSNAELRTANQALQRSNQALEMSRLETARAREDAEAILRTIHYALVVLTKELRVQTANQAFYRLFRIDPRQAEGRPFLELGRGQWDVPKLPRMLSEIVTANRSFEDFEVSGEFELLGFRTMLLSGQRLEAQGDDTRVLLAIDDVTESRKLERLVAERTAALAEKVGELEAFSYSVAHDLRAPLRAMQGFANILTDEYARQLGVEGKDYLHRITTAAERMDLLIQDVLNYSRLVRSDLALSAVEVERLLRGMLESYSEFQPPKSEIHLEGQFPAVLANEAGLTQCFSNLLGNAIKFVGPGVKPRVRIWAQSDEDRVRIFFQDNGIGIARENQARIWEMFQQLSKRYEGTGVGLAIVRKAAERMKGTVGLDSEPGKGSTFWIELNRAAA